MVADRSDQLPIFFLHIPKAAGSSINAFITERLGAESKVRVHLESDKEWIDSSADVRWESHEFLSGHVRWGAFKKRCDPSDFFKITVIREPTHHLLSHLSWVRHLCDPGQEDFKAAHPISIQHLAEELADADFTNLAWLSGFLSNMEGLARAMFDNAQSRYLLDGEIDRRLSVVDVGNAVGRLDGFDLVGLTENLDPFLGVLCRKRKWVRPTVQPAKNVRADYYGLDPSASDVQEATQIATAGDSLLYKLAKSSWPSL